MYAVAHAVYMAHHDHKNPIPEVMDALQAINFDRPARRPSSSEPLRRGDTIFAGTLVDPESGRIAAGRAAWEAAADAILESILPLPGRAAKSVVGTRSAR
jgi:hypothetical protein